MTAIFVFPLQPPIGATSFATSYRFADKRTRQLGCILKKTIVIAGLVPATHEHPIWCEPACGLTKGKRNLVPRDATIAVYMMSNRKHGTLYAGVTSMFIKRIFEHQEGAIEGFTRKYGLKRLVWYELHESMTAAIQREKTIKKYKREWKLNLIERENPNWDDLFPGILRSWF
jgi:putative endonuclease